MICEQCDKKRHSHYGCKCEPEPQTGKAKTLEGFEEQLAGLYDWEELTRLMYETKCPKLLAFFEGLELVSDDG
jgi:hypothetical protein